MLLMNNLLHTMLDIKEDCFNQISLVFYRRFCSHIHQSTYDLYLLYFKSKNIYVYKYILF